MQVIAFKAILEKEGIIHIPEQYLENISSSVRVVILSDEKPLKNKNKHFSAMSLETRGFKFNREEANE
jgi:hypothetical protein